MAGDCIDFDAARRERKQQDQPTKFTLGGETFPLRALSLGNVWLDELHEDGLPVAPERFAPSTENGKAMLNWARAIAFRIPPEERERWWSIFDNDDDPIDGGDLLEVLDKLTELATGRPTAPSNGSADGRNDTTTGTTSNDQPDETSAATSSTSASAQESAGSS